MLKFLFLDDDHSRHVVARNIPGYHGVFTAEDAIRELENNSPWPAVFLDHDLGGEEMVDSHGPELTGYTVAKWCEEHTPQVNLYVVHSLNSGGAANMMAALRKFNTKRLPFDHIKKLTAWDIMHMIRQSQGDTDAA